MNFVRLTQTQLQINSNVVQCLVDVKMSNSLLLDLPFELYKIFKGCFEAFERLKHQLLEIQELI